MSIRMTKALLARGMITAAGSSSAFYVMAGSAVSLPYDRYCAFVGGGGSYTGVMERTLPDCENKLQAALSGLTFGGIIQACHLCSQKFASFAIDGSGGAAGSAAELPADLPIETMRRFLEGTRTLRERYRIDEYERAQQEFERSLHPATKP